KQDTVWQTYQGRTLCLSEWASEFGMKYDLLYGRIKAGWSPERALTTPGRRARLIAFGGQTLTIEEWAEARGLNYTTLVYRLKRGWSVRRALTAAPTAPGRFRRAS